jgi:glycosyltransferase involved in cell wall biosynthesis
MKPENTKPLKKALYIAFYFPPCGSSSTARNIGFVSNLCKFGIEAHVIAPEIETIGKIPLTRIDNSFENQLKDIKKTRTRTFIPTLFINLIMKLRLSRFLKVIFPFEFHIFWFFPAVRSALKVIEKEKVDFIFSSSLPNTAHLIGMYLAKRTGLPWFADFQDPMAYRLGMTWFTRYSHKLIAFLEKTICKRATGIIVHSPSSRDILLESYPFLSPEKVVAITNAYDFPLQFEELPSKSLKKMRIVHSGEFYSHFEPDKKPLAKKISEKFFSFFDYANYSADFSPHSIVPLALALKKAIQLAPEIRGKVEVLHNGYIHPCDEKFIESLGLSGLIKTTGLTSYAQSMEHIFSADLLYFPLAIDLKRKVNNWIPGKLPIYLSALKPILGLVQEGDSKVILEESGLGIFGDPSDIDSLARILLNILKKMEDGQKIINTNIKYIKKFSREERTRELVDFIENKIQNSPGQ